MAAHRHCRCPDGWFDRLERYEFRYINPVSSVVHGVALQRRGERAVHHGKDPFLTTSFVPRKSDAPVNTQDLRYIREQQQRLRNLPPLTRPTTRKRIDIDHTIGDVFAPPPITSLLTFACPSQANTVAEMWREGRTDNSKYVVESEYIRAVPVRLLLSDARSLGSAMNIAVTVILQSACDLDEKETKKEKEKEKEEEEEEERCSHITRFEIALLKNP